MTLTMSRERLGIVPAFVLTHKARIARDVRREDGCELAFDGLRGFEAHRTSSGAMTHSFDHLVGAGEERGRDRQAEGFGGLEVDDQLRTWSACSIGKSAGCVPFKMRSTNVAE